MKIIKILAGLLVALVALFLIVPFFLSSEFRFERTVEIAREANDIERYVADYRNWQAWSPWTELEPDAEWSFAGEHGRVGASMTWKGHKIGHGTNTILNIEPGRSIRARLVFLDPYPSEGFDVWYFDRAGDDSTKVTWAHETKLEYPTGRLFGLFLGRMLAPDFERGLAKLKATLENRAK